MFPIDVGSLCREQSYLLHISQFDEQANSNIWRKVNLRKKKKDE